MLVALVNRFPFRCSNNSNNASSGQALDASIVQKCEMVHITCKVAHNGHTPNSP
ncbi:hypothetical protein VPHK251G3_0069 [Vibrio phage K251 g3]